MATGAVRVSGLRELQVAFAKISKDLGKEIRKELKEAAEPVRVLAERKALAEISHIGPRWSLMRVGVTTRVAYVAPRSRRRGGSPRSNLGALLMNRAMQPALDEMEPEVVARVGLMIDRLGGESGF